jgi:hypothetical protein
MRKGKKALLLLTMTACLAFGSEVSAEMTSKGTTGTGAYSTYGTTTNRSPESMLEMRRYAAFPMLQCISIGHCSRGGGPDHNMVTVLRVPRQRTRGEAESQVQILGKTNPL